MRKIILIVCVCWAAQMWAADVTVSVSAEKVAKNNSWQMGGFYDSFVLDKIVTIKAKQPDTDKKNGYYSFDNPHDWRMYQARNNGEFSISVKAGYIIRSFSLTYGTTQTGVLSTVPGINVPQDNQISSGQVVMLNDKSVTLYVGNTTTTTNGQVRLTQFTITYCNEDTTSLVETFSQVDQTSCNDEQTVWQGDVMDWEVFRARRGTKDTLNGGVPGTWMKQGGYFKATDTIGGIKRLHFEWRQFLNNKADAELVLAISAADAWADTARMIAVAEQALSQNYSYDVNVACQQNVLLSLTNISPDAANSADRFLLGDLFITPYLYLPEQYRHIDLNQYDRWDMSSVLLDNTEGEGAIAYTIVSDSTMGAAIYGSVVDLSGSRQSGPVVVRASWQGVYVETRLQVTVPETNILFTETFSNCLHRQMTGTTYVVGDGELYEWNISQFTRQDADTVAGQQGIRLCHGGAIATNGEQEGGIRELAFQWRAADAHQPIHFTVMIDGTKYDYTCTAEEAASRQMRYVRPCAADHNAAFSISVEKAESPAQSTIVVGAVSVAPYILFTAKNRLDTVLLTDTTIYDLSEVLLDNTNGQGTIQYSILSDETRQARMSGSKINLAHVTTNGTILVQAQWGNVTTTMNLYALYSVTALHPISDSVHGTSCTKIIVNGEVRILRNGRYYSVIGNPIDN